MSIPKGLHYLHLLISCFLKLWLAGTINILLYQENLLSAVLVMNCWTHPTTRSVKLLWCVDSRNGHSSLLLYSITCSDMFCIKANLLNSVCRKLWMNYSAQLSYNWYKTSYSLKAFNYCRMTKGNGSPHVCLCQGVISSTTQQIFAEIIFAEKWHDLSF